MEKSRQLIEDYNEKTQLNPQFIAFDLIDNKKVNPVDDALNNGEGILDKHEKHKGYPSLNGLEQNYSQVKVVFADNIEKRLENVAKIVTGNNYESGTDLTAASLPFSLNSEEDFANLHNL
jgi:hypothetical protein